MAEFHLFAPLLHSLEKGVADHKEDKGGFTVDGVTLTTFRRYYGADKTREDLLAMTAGEWAFIMKSGYWDKCKADRIDDQKIAEIIADWCVNSGTARIRNVQTILGVKPDGIVGRITLGMINASEAKVLHERLWQARYQFYHSLVKNNPSQKVFLKGWLNRLEHFRYK